jgi:hypothetical protein
MRRAAGAAALAGACLLVSAGASGAARIGVPAGWKVCTNRTLGFSIAYPTGWHTARLRPAGACLYFEPKPFRIPPNSDFTGTALEVLPTQQSYAGLLRTLTDRRFSRVQARSRTTLAGRPATRLETIATGAGLLARGTRTYAYVIDRGRRPAFIVQTTRAEPAGWAARKRILDRAVRTLRFFAA